MGLVVLVGLGVAVKYFNAPAILKQALDWIKNLGGWAPIIFIAVYVVACVLLLPGWILTLGAGAVFGVIRGSIYVSIGAILGATAAFLVGRYLAREWVAKKIAAYPKFTAIDKAVADEGWKIVGLTRLSPLFPFNLLNYAFGLTRVSLRDYVLASWIGMIPGTVMYVYIGSLANAAADKKTTVEWVLRGVGLLATIAVTVLVTRIAKKALAQKIAN
ncbi:MAG: hypothetical protein DME26_22080 [Verrucomicrobia bacterium]|nr:MAG: hypothetical protein DME26_22080 [Verrucomicrobiota bacterium]